MNINKYQILFHRRWFWFSCGDSQYPGDPIYKWHVGFAFWEVRCSKTWGEL